MGKSILNNRGQTYSDYYNKGGKPDPQRTANAMKGVKAGPGFTAPGPPQVKYCSATTNAGTACKARPVKGGMLCAGHIRQAESLVDVN